MQHLGRPTLFLFANVVLTQDEFSVIGKDKQQKKLQKPQISKFRSEKCI